MTGPILIPTLLIEFSDKDELSLIKEQCFEQYREKIYPVVKDHVAVDNIMSLLTGQVNILCMALRYTPPFEEVSVKLPNWSLISSDGNLEISVQVIIQRFDSAIQ